MSRISLAGIIGSQVGLDQTISTFWAYLMNGISARLAVAMLNAIVLAVYWSCVGVQWLWRRCWAAVRN